MRQMLKGHHDDRLSLALVRLLGNSNEGSRGVAAGVLRFADVSEVPNHCEQRGEDLFGGLSRMALEETDAFAHDQSIGAMFNLTYQSRESAQKLATCPGSVVALTSTILRCDRSLFAKAMACSTLQFCVMSSADLRAALIQTGEHQDGIARRLMAELPVLAEAHRLTPAKEAYNVARRAASLLDSLEPGYQITRKRVVDSILGMIVREDRQPPSHSGDAPPGQGRGCKRRRVSDRSTKVKCDPDVAAASDFACVICAEDPDPTSTILTLPCLHRFHENCMTSWFLRSNTCPTCRHDTVAAIVKRVPESPSTIESLKAKLIGLVSASSALSSAQTPPTLAPTNAEEDDQKERDAKRQRRPE